VRRFGAAAFLTATLAIAAAGCGGSDPSAEEDWAGDVCSSVSDWQDQIEESAADIREQIESPGAGTLAAVESEIEEGVDASKELADDLQSLEPPDTEAGEQAQQEIDSLADQVEETVEKTKETIDSLPENASLSEVVETVGPLLPSLQALATNVSATLASVQERGSDLKEGFDKADSCEKYR
jgi:uncharacterized phage infection (PIP) family protein YhgE